MLYALCIVEDSGSGALCRPECRPTQGLTVQALAETAVREVEDSVTC